MVKGLFPIEELSARRTPFYYYDSALLRATLAEISSLLLRYPDWKVHYALKANFNPALLQIIAEYGLGADCATGGEIQAALDAGFAPDGIVYTGVGKRDEDIRLALNADDSMSNPWQNCRLLMK